MNHLSKAIRAAALLCGILAADGGGSFNGLTLVGEIRKAYGAMLILR
jgi:hypothetical protein